MDEDLKALTEITDQDIEDAIAEWESNPPDDEFAAILIAEGPANASD